MKKSAFISDVFFTFFACSLFTLCFFRYTGISLFTSLFLSGVCGLLAAFSAYAFLQSKRKSFFLKKSDETQKEKLLLHLALSSDEANTQYFKNALSSALDTAVQKFGKLRLFTPSEFYFLHFSLSPVTADQVASYSRLKTGKQKILLCTHIEEAANTLCQRLDIRVKTGEQVYLLLKEREFLPQNYLGEENAAAKQKRRFKLWFSKTNGKRFFLGGSLVLFTSLITPFPFYYLVFGSILWLTALLVRIFGYEN